MKRNIIAFTAVFLLLSIAPISAPAQTRSGTAGAPSSKPAAPQPAPGVNAAVPDTKIALVDTILFGDEKAGITRFLKAVKAVESEFQPQTVELNNLQSRIQLLADEITKLSGSSVVSAQTIQAKQEEAERLQRELKYKKEQADADFEKRYKEVAGPVTTDIRKALDQYASQRGVTMILDISKLAPAVLTVNPAMDITQAFIAEFNSKNP